LHAVIIVLLIALAGGCSDDVKHQEEFRGKWQLQARSYADGRELRAPDINGTAEWFPVNRTKAHATFSFSSQVDQIQLTGAIYELQGQAFTRTEYLSIGGGYGLTHQPAYETTKKEDRGTRGQDGTVNKLVQAGGEIYAFEADTLTVTYGDGTVDTWMRTADQKGVLAK
jgi:hypothetical protein